jgi:XTP/dITP diphosphohydrolase
LIGGGPIDTKPKLLLATNNRGKLREYRELLGGIPFELVTPADLGVSVDVEETGMSYEENASRKALTAARRTGLLSLADDSGLEVDDLGGAPGPLSARYAGANASDKDRIDLLLSRLKDIPARERSARFRCVIAIASPEGKVEFFSGVCSGLITDKPRGAQGFGYDPIFFIPELGKTMAELTLEEKNKVSHRARAAGKAREMLKRLAAQV